MALDDFGTEYSSIALLRKLKPQWIKIDHTFVRSIQDDEMDQAILEYIMNLSKQTRIKGLLWKGWRIRKSFPLFRLISRNCFRDTIIPDPVRRRNFQRNISMEKIRQAATVV